MQDCDETLKQNMIVNVGNLAYFTFKNNQTLFTKEQILKEDILKEDELNLLIHYQFLYSKQKWYCFSHPFLQVFLMILCLRGRRKRGMLSIRNWGFSLWKKY